jgi:hypothetical protein
MTKDEFFQQVRDVAPEELAREFLNAGTVRVFPDEAAYQDFRDRIQGFVNEAEFVAVVGSGNWRFSLNPEKDFREFGEHSDVDVAIVSQARFNSLWEEMRERHRKRFYRLSQDQRTRLRRNSENVYAGFISPSWIPDRSAQRRYEHKALLNELSDASVGYLSVKLMFFKNLLEAIDYYRRGFIIAKAKLREKEGAQ